ncbi:MAG: endonuclease domain-containing protein [Chloroflexi bacterium]|nr:endonuclease domain-containing protein [Chloroflexota bacterium]
MKSQRRPGLTKKYPAPSREIIERAKELRKNATEAEQHLWQHLRRLQLGGYRFRRQCPVGAYIVDFFCFEKGLAVELDGSCHSQQADYDAERTLWLESQGIRVLRFANSQVLDEVESVKQSILQALRPPL